MHLAERNTKCPELTGNDVSEMGIVSKVGFLFHQKLSDFFFPHGLDTHGQVEIFMS